MATTITASSGARTVLIVQKSLPLRLTRTPLAPPVDGSVSDGASFSWSAEWDDEALLNPRSALAAHESSLAAGRGASGLSKVRVTWIGMPTADVPPEDEEVVTRLLEPLGCIPVFLPPATARSFIDGYCRDTLYPVFHNVMDVYGEVPTRWWIKKRQSDRWKAYMDANQKFSTAVVENYHEGDLVWVLDYHLLLIPAQLARRHISPISLFINTPFPSSEIFRSLSVRDELLRGMLSSDIIGFHLFEHARHFLTCCRRILGLRNAPRRCGRFVVEFQGREVFVTVSHVGVEPSFLLGRFTTVPSIVTDAAEWRTRFPTQRIVAGIDTTERLKGVSLKLSAFEAMLAAYPELVSTVVLVQLCVERPEENRPDEVQDASASEIAALVERVNARFGRPGSPVVHFELRSEAVPLAQRLALWAATDVLLNTAIRDGLNLHPFEFITVRSFSSGAVAARAGNDAAVLAASASLINGNVPNGILVLSEFSGASRVLAGALRVNPWKQGEVMSALFHALTMPRDEADARTRATLSYVSSNTTSAWAERMLADLAGAAEKERSGSQTLVGYGLGLGYRLQGFGANFRPLNLENVLTAYRRAARRLIVVDYGGTLHVRDSTQMRRKAFEMGLMHGKDAAPPIAPDTRKALKILASDPANTVFVISGKEREVMQAAFAELPLVGLAAEHGFYYRWGGLRASAEKEANGAAGPRDSSANNTPIPGISQSQRGSSTASLADVTPRSSVSSSLGRDDADSENEKKLSDNGQPWLSMLDGTGSAPLSSMTPMASLPPKSGNAADWKQITGSIMDLYAARTHGTYVLRKSSALSWHYADADPEFGSLQAQELSDGLQGVLRGLPVDVLSGVGWIEVRPRGVSKGAVLAHIMDKLEGRDGEAAGGCPPPLEFILCVGDDNADEDMFATVQSYRTKRVAEHTSAVAALKGASSSLPPQSLTYYEYTVTVGKKPSKAAYFLDDTAQTEEVLKGLARATLRSRAAAPAAAAASSLTAPSAAAAPASALGNLTASLPISAGPPIPLSAISRPAPTGPAGTAAGAASLANLLAAGGSMLNLAGLNTNVLFDPAFATAFPGAAAAAAAAMSAAQPATGGGPRQVPAGAVSMVSFPMAFAAGGGGNLLGPSRVILSAAKPVASATDGSDSPPNGAASPPLNSAGGSSGGVAMAGGLRAGSLNALAGLFTGSTNRLAALPGGGALGPVNEDRDESRDEDECAPAKSLKSKDTKPSLALGDDSDFESEEDDVALQQQPQSAPTPNAASGPRGTFVLSAVPRAEDLNVDADDDVPEF